MSNSDIKLPVFVLLGVGLLILAWLFRDAIWPADEPTMIEAQPPAEADTGPTGPLYPLAGVDAENGSSADLVPLPALSDSDSYFLLAIIDAFGKDIERLLVNKDLIDKFVATVDNLDRKYVAEKTRPVLPLAGAFTVDADEQSSDIYLSAENYARYDALMTIIAGADLDAVAALYQRFYPLLQESYVSLGYPNGYFNDRVVEVIDHLLATPVPAAPLRLVRPHVLYEFADPQLQALSSGQKLLLRVGSDHAATIKRVLRGLRAKIV